MHMLNKYKIILCFYILGQNILLSQNLVPNPSFEDFVSCLQKNGRPGANFDIDTNWSCPNETSPDFYSSKCDN